MGNKTNLSTSFIQREKHISKTEKFQVITPSQIATVLADYGFDLINLKTGRAKNPDRQDFQTTIARYRHRDEFEVKGNHFDLVFKVPHLYGALTGLMGIFRMVCSNGLIAGTTFEAIKVKHLGNPMAELNELIPAMVAQRAALVSQVEAMQARHLSLNEIAELCAKVAAIRLGPDSKAININYRQLLTPRRNEDQKTDLYSVMNILQENVMRNGFQYQVESTVAETGVTYLRNQTAKPLAMRQRIETESVRTVDTNVAIWDAAAEFLKRAA